MENLVGELDIPSYTRASTSITTPTTSNLRTREEPPDSSLAERGNINNGTAISKAQKSMSDDRNS